MSTETRPTQEEQLHATGVAAWESIAEMVAALDCDFERLAELRDEIEALGEEINETEEAISNEEDEETPDRDQINELREELTRQETELTELRAELDELEDEANGCDDEDEARQRIDEDPLSIQVRSGWGNIGETLQPEEFEILLSTGGPASRIRGELNEYNEPCRAWLEVQDWGTPWTQVFAADQETLLRYCSCFYFGG